MTYIYIPAKRRTMGRPSLRRWHVSDGVGWLTLSSATHGYLQPTREGNTPTAAHKRAPLWRASLPGAPACLSQYMGALDNRTERVTPTAAHKPAPLWRARHRCGMGHGVTAGGSAVAMPCMAVMPMTLLC